MGWGIIGATHRHLILLDTLYHPLHALGAATMIFWAIIPIEDQRGNVGNRVRTDSHHCPRRSAKPSLLTLEVTPYTNSSSNVGRKMPTGVRVASG